MNPTVASCAACGYVFPDQEALEPCPKCGGKERALQRETLGVDRSTPDKVVKFRRAEKRQPDGSCEVVERPVEEIRSTRSPGREVERA
jgi:hypothetical protein